VYAPSFGVVATTAPFRTTSMFVALPLHVRSTLGELFTLYARAASEIVGSAKLVPEGREPENASVEFPEAHYAWNGNVALAYQVIGEGPIDLIYLQGACSHVDMNWESPYLAGLLRALARHARLIITDRRGFGCSDRFSPTDIPPFEVFTDDILTVMDAVGSRRAAIFGTWDCALIATLWAAAYPDRAAALILADAFVTYAATAETPWMPTPEQWEERIATPVSRAGYFLGDDSLLEGTEQRWFHRYLRASIGPGAHIAEIRRYLDTDVRAVLSSVHVPTLILQDADGTNVNSPKTGRYLRDHIPGAKLVELAGHDRHHWYWGSEPIAANIAGFLADVRDEEADHERILATVLFTDIVGSTEKAAEIGGRRWRELVEAHHASVRAHLARFKGNEVDTAGDGFFATFDGPVRALRCAKAIVDSVERLGVQVRAGLHIGECEVIDNKIGGMAVNIGSRICALAGASEILVSQTIKDLVAGSGLGFEERGTHKLKGVPEEWRLFTLEMD
jgi:class 3 adenylate cyclase